MCQVRQGQLLSDLEMHGYSSSRGPLSALRLMKLSFCQTLSCMSMQSGRSSSHSTSCLSLQCRLTVLATFAASNPELTYHQSDESFNLIKQKRGELRVDKYKHVIDTDLNLIICNDTCAVQYIYLLTTYCPLFVTMDFDEATGKPGLRALGRFDLIKRAIGLVFPQRVRGNLLHQSFKEVRDAAFIQNRPIVFMPECTKTNGKGVLSIPDAAL